MKKKYFPDEKSSPQSRLEIEPTKPTVAFIKPHAYATAPRRPFLSNIYEYFDLICIFKYTYIHGKPKGHINMYFMNPIQAFNIKGTPIGTKLIALSVRTPVTQLKTG